MDAIVSGSTEVEEIELVNYFKTLTSLNKRGGDDLEEDFRVIKITICLFLLTS